MKWHFVSGPLQELKVEGLAAGVFEDLDFGPLPKELGLAEAAGKVRFKGKEGECFYAFDLFGQPRKHLLLVGLGKKDALKASALRAASALAVRKFRERYLGSAAIALPLDLCASGPSEAACAAVEGALLANAKFLKYFTDPEAKFEGIGELVFHVPKKRRELDAGARLGGILAGATLFARDLVNEPANLLTPVKMAEEARKVAKAAGLGIKVFGPKECARMGMGAFLAVGLGSKNEPRFIHLSYRPAGAKFRLGLVGKGLTFDTGGICLKPREGMEDMKGDMGGSAAVLGAMKAIGELKPKVAVEAVMAMTENMPGGGAFRPGDILTSMSGKTIEVKNTDAEGRLALADGLTYIQKQKVDAIVDLATLTGACVIALGPDFSGAMGNDQPLIDALLAASRESGDDFWQLPMPAAYAKYMKSSVADVCNMSRVRYGGAITAAHFLETFVEKGTPWAHLDIAGPSFRDEDGTDAHKAEGSGAGVRTLVRFVLSKEKA